VKYLIIILLLLPTGFLYSQEDSLRVIVRHDVIEPDLVNPTTRIQTYININDSLDLFIDNIQKLFGEVEDENGIFVWNKIELDSALKDFKIVMANGIWSTKKDISSFTPASVSKTEKLNSKEKRGIRIRVFKKDGKDALSSKTIETEFVRIFEELLNKTPEETLEE
jgi:hypothetical protein